MSLSVLYVAAPNEAPHGRRSVASAGAVVCVMLLRRTDKQGVMTSVDVGVDSHVADTENLREKLRNDTVLWEVSSCMTF